MSSAGRLYLLGSSNGRAVSDVFRRVSAELGTARSRPKVAFSLAALPSSGVEATIRRLLESAFHGGTVSRFAVTGEDGATAPSEARAVVEQADVLFFGGGDPVLVARRLVAAGADAWVRDACARGAICIGLSAGSIALGAFWGSWSDDDPDGEPEVVPCIRAAARLVVDCHAEEDDWAELRAVRHALGSRASGLTFVGVGHGAAVIVTPSGELEWLGRQMVLGA